MKDVIVYNQVKICKWIHWCWFSTLEQVCIYYNCEHLAQVKPNPASIHDILIHTFYSIQSIQIKPIRKLHIFLTLSIVNTNKLIKVRLTIEGLMGGVCLFVCYIVYYRCILRTADLFLSILILIFKLWNFCWIMKWHSKVN